jgi:hypothetical protein
MNKPTPDGMPERQIPNESVVSHARQFRDTADFLYAHLIEHNYFAAPLMMVAAFGIELFLKSLNSKWVYSQGEHEKTSGGYVTTATPSKKVHPLTELFDEIDTYFRTGLEAAYTATPGLPGKSTLREALADYKDHFVDSRYPFEDGKSIGNLSGTDLVGLLDLIGDHIDKLKTQVFPPKRP